MVMLAKVAKDDDFVAALLSAIPSEVVACGVLSERELEQTFPRVKTACRRLAHVPEYGGILSHALSYIVTALTFEQHGLAEGESVEAVLARAEYFVANRNLDMVSQRPGTCQLS